MKYDLLVSVMAILIAGVLFEDKDIAFSLIGTNTNWFWFSLLTYFILETPFMLWYLNRYDMWKKF